MKKLISVLLTLCLLLLPAGGRGEDEPLYRFAAAYEKEHPVDYFIFGHYHAEVDMTLPGGARLLMSKSWMDDSPYWYSDGISVFLGHSKKIE